MEFQQVVQRRRMVRAFQKDRPVPPQVVRRILENALRAPSAGHTQGWAFLVLQGPEETGQFWNALFPQKRRTRFAYPGLFDAPLIIVPLASQSAYVERYAENDKGWTDRDESRWPVPFWHIDTGFAAMLMLLTAVDEQLGALFFGIFDVEAFRTAFGVGEQHTPIGAIAIGYPLPDRRSPSLARGRRSLEECVHWGTWSESPPAPTSVDSDPAATIPTT